MAVCLRDEFVRIYRSLGVFRILLRSHPAHSIFQRRVFHYTPDLDRSRCSHVPPVLAANRHLCSACGALLRIDTFAIPDPKDYGEPPGSIAGDLADGVSLILLVERRLVLHRRPRQHLRPPDARRPDICRPVCTLEVVAAGRRRARSEGFLLPVLPDRVFSAGFRLLLLCAPSNGASPVDLRMEALRVGIRLRHRCIWRVQHGDQRTFPFLHQLRGNGCEARYQSQPLQRFDLRLAGGRLLACAPCDRNDRRSRLPGAKAKHSVCTQRGVSSFLAALSIVERPDHGVLATRRTACLAAIHIQQLLNASSFPRPGIPNRNRHHRLGKEFPCLDLRGGVRWSASFRFTCRSIRV